MDLRRKYADLITFVVLAFLLGGVTVSCDRSDGFPDEPVITKLEFDTDIRSMVIEFTDGDGDFGIDGDDPDFPQYLDPDSTELNPYYTNLWIDYYEKQEGEWVLVEPENTFNFRVPVLTPTGQNKQLEVVITNDLSADIPYPTAESDTIKFIVTLVDRAKNESIPAETGELFVPAN